MDLTNVWPDIGANLNQLVQDFNLVKLFGATASSTVLLVVLQVLRTQLLRLFAKRLPKPTTIILKKLTFYLVLFIILLFFLESIGVNSAAVWGTAGVAGLALGFASQAAISNLISGLFLLAEKAFAVGDVISVDGQSGVVVSLDLLSVKVKTFDNTFIRIPNESLMKNKMTNITRFPIRRLDLAFKLPFSTDLKRAMDIISQVVAENRYSLENPEPYLGIQNFTEKGIEILLGVWFEKEDLLALRNSLMLEIFEKFRQEGIFFAVPNYKVHVSTAKKVKPVSPLPTT